MIRLKVEFALPALSGIKVEKQQGSLLGQMPISDSKNKTEPFTKLLPTFIAYTAVVV